MTITVARLLTELGNRAWSGFNKDDMTFSNEDAQTAITELNIANRYLLNKADFLFKEKVEEFKTSKNVKSYDTVTGQILDVIDKKNNSSLTFIENADKLEELTGTPTHYYINYSNPTSELILYPTPSEIINMAIRYQEFMPILSANGQPKNEFTVETDKLNLPSHLEFLYMDCLILRTMEQNNKDNQDENYAPIQKELSEMWNLFVSKATPNRNETCITI